MHQFYKSLLKMYLFYQFFAESIGQIKIKQIQINRTQVLNHFAWSRNKQKFFDKNVDKHIIHRAQRTGNKILLHFHMQFMFDYVLKINCNAQKSKQNKNNIFYKIWSKTLNFLIAKFIYVCFNKFSFIFS